ncbi:MULTISPECIES: glycosyltransferase family 4 protein [Geobacter]|uniref:glycosyltransferase family 4 protein n=1 Tax=Geobacter TaxID=28231 RepID=UPI0020B67294|nr:glycosyltransferase family 4 protein [Geobacter sulfurreducens]UTG91311.1 glycosyltransferase family 4 protein [Geobacter sulfurreducens]BEH10156.1 glycosyltransferase [Geobacter sulfurreducens subsp. ethanolicus]BET58258.1 glycosyltransferase [Geobacter sp. 60473]
MKILSQSRVTLFSVFGGDTVQMLKTKEYLNKLGVQFDISTDTTPNLDGYDIVHLFNLIRPQDVLSQARNAKRQGKKIALSTIYGLYTEYDQKARGLAGRLITRFLSTGQIEYLKVCSRAVLNRELSRATVEYICKGHIRAQREIIEMTDVFLPNSESEMQRVWADFPESRSKPYIVVPNAADVELFNYEQVKISPNISKYVDAVLCVARIEGRKNQLNLVRSMEGLPWQLVLIGKAAPNHLTYYDQIKRCAGNNVHLLGQVEHSDLPQFYKAARVHCLVSWMETPGLSSLEAAAMGCNVVVTDKGDPRDYFGDYAFYCEPDSIDSIRSAIIRAYENPIDPALRKRVLENYTWTKAAEKTLEGYRYGLDS